MNTRALQQDALREYLEESLWFVPALSVAAAGLLLGANMWLEQVVDDNLSFFRGDAEAARNVASTIAASMMGFIAVVFSITIVALQLASGQFSPRALRTFLRNRTTKVALGVFVGTFAYSVLLLSSIDPDADRAPQLAVAAMFVLTFLSIAAFIAYIDAIAHSIRVVSVLDAIAGETWRAVHRRFPTDGSRGPADRTGEVDVPDEHPVTRSGRGGVLVGVDYDRLVEVAVDADCTFRVCPAVGDFVRHGAPLVWSTRQIEEPARVEACFESDIERTMRQDPAFGIRQLVDIAERALSPGLNDPTTAVQSIDRIHDLMACLATRDFPDAAHRDSTGTVRVLANEPEWNDYVTLATDELRLYADSALPVYRRLVAMLRDLEGIAPAHRVDEVRSSLKLIEELTDERFETAEDSARAERPDAQGQGGSNND